MLLVLVVVVLVLELPFRTTEDEDDDEDDWSRLGCTLLEWKGTTMTLNPAAARRARLIRRIRREKLDALLVTNVHNVRYLSGFLGDDSALLVTPDRTTLLTDSRYAEQAEAETRGIGIVVRRKGMMPVAAATARKAGVRTLGVEGRTMTMAEAEDLRKALPRVAVKPTRGMVERLRIVKDASEIAAISRAAAIADEAFRLTLPHVDAGPDRARAWR